MQREPTGAVVDEQLWRGRTAADVAEVDVGGAVAVDIAGREGMGEAVDGGQTRSRCVDQPAVWTLDEKPSLIAAAGCRVWPPSPITMSPRASPLKSTTKKLPGPTFRGHQERTA